MKALINSTFIVAALLVSLPVRPTSAAAPASTQIIGAGARVDVGEKIPSEDSIVPDFHSMGLIDGRNNIYRCACPVRDLTKHMTTTQPTDVEYAKALSRMQHLYKLGIRTDISFQNPNQTGHDEEKDNVAAAVNLESSTARAAGIIYVACPISNSGPNSLQTMSDQAVLLWLRSVAKQIFQSSARGGVIFHCTAGHDRAGLVAAYLRMKYQHWSAEEAIAEMRRLGHNWPKFSADGGISSWHEAHVRAIATIIDR
jgi:Tyrosine phosphatase family